MIDQLDSATEDSSTQHTEASTSRDKAFYDDEVPLDGMADYSKVVRQFVHDWLNDLGSLHPRGHNLDVLELGAGSCITSLLVSRSPLVRRITASDISTARMREMVDYNVALIGGDKSKIGFAEIDFNARLPFDDASFDVIVFDAALHHSRNIWHTLEECYRILRHDGLLVAQREQFLSPLSYRYAINRLLNSVEVAHGVSENAYLPQQYRYYFEANGFSITFRPVLPKALFRLLRPLNGLLFSKYNMIGRRVENFREKRLVSWQARQGGTGTP